MAVPVESNAVWFAFSLGNVLKCFGPGDTPGIAPHAFAYQEDIIVFGCMMEYMANLKEVFQRLMAANLRINTVKCHLFMEELLYLDHRITSQTIGMDPGKVGKRKPPKIFLLQINASDYSMCAVLAQDMEEFDLTRVGR